MSGLAGRFGRFRTDDTAEEPADSGHTAEVVPLSRRRVAAPEKVPATAEYRSRDLEPHSTSLTHAAKHGQLSSRAAQREWVASKAWLPPDVPEGGLADVEGTWYYRLIGNRLFDLGLAIAWIGERQLRFWYAAIIAAATAGPIAIWIILRLA